jgi:flavin-dependent dehydrogenase
VVAPATLRLIRALGLSPPREGVTARICRGVLSVWSVPQEQFFDYELYGFEAALAVDRAAYDRALVAEAADAGVGIASASIRHVTRCAAGWHVRVGSMGVTARLLVDATGRNSRLVARAVVPRHLRDRLVAFSFHVGSRAVGDVLLVEAVPDGWWYLCGSSESDGSLVYLSDSDLVPRHSAGRPGFFHRSFSSTRLVRDHVPEVPDFTVCRGLDARTGSRSQIADRGWVAVGDAAISVDPLSGDGIRLAFESAQHAASGVASWLRDGRSQSLHAYTAWGTDAERRLLVQRQHTYASVMREFHGEPFWSRRMELT